MIDQAEPSAIKALVSAMTVLLGDQRIKEGRGTRLSGRAVLNRHVPPIPVNPAAQRARLVAMGAQHAHGHEVGKLGAEGGRQAPRGGLVQRRLIGTVTEDAARAHRDAGERLVKGHRPGREPDDVGEFAPGLSTGS